MSSSESIKAGLAASPRVTLPEERYRLVVIEFYHARLAWMLTERPLLDATIIRQLGELNKKLDASVAFNPDAAPKRDAVAHAHENGAAFTAWVRRHPDKVARIVAEASGRPLGTVASTSP